jgi:hypothetical protein
MDIFFAGGFWCFCRGFFEKAVVRCGFFVVNLWWDCGDLWCVDGRYLGSKIFHFSKIFLGEFPFWEFRFEGSVGGLWSLFDVSLPLLCEMQDVDGGGVSFYCKG